MRFSIRHILGLMLIVALIGTIYVLQQRPNEWELENYIDNAYAERDKLWWEALTAEERVKIALRWWNEDEPLGASNVARIDHGYLQHFKP